MAAVPWNKQAIVRALVQSHRAGHDLSHSGIGGHHPGIVAAAGRHFGSYRKACGRAGLDYAALARRPKWTKPAIIRLIKCAYREGADLRWSAVVAGEAYGRRGKSRPLARAAFAAIQPRLFGSWDRALHAAGLDAGEIAQYRHWDRATIVADLKSMWADGDKVHPAAVRAEDPGLYAAAVRHFGGFAAAAKAAHIPATAARARQSWSPERISAQLARFKGQPDAEVRRREPALHAAAVRHFGSFRRAMQQEK